MRVPVRITYNVCSWLSLSVREKSFTRPVTQMPTKVCVAQGPGPCATMWHKAPGLVQQCGTRPRALCHTNLCRHPTLWHKARGHGPCATMWDKAPGLVLQCCTRPGALCHNVAQGPGPCATMCTRPGALCHNVPQGPGPCATQTFVGISLTGRVKDFSPTVI